MEDVNLTDRKSSVPEPHMLRFLSHMFITAVLAPAAGGAVWIFCSVDWHNTALLARLLGSLMGGFVLLAFTWLATVPLGLLTSAVCFALSRGGVKNRALWMIGGAGFGLLFGQFIAVWAHIAPGVVLGSGVCIGAATGAVLREVWCHDTDSSVPNEAAPTVEPSSSSRREK